jgi:hypothetical protein
MKHLLAACAGLMMLAVANPAMAQYHDNQGHGDNNDHGRSHSYHRAPPPPPRHRAYYHEGQMWHGHRLMHRGNNWGYYQPRNGAQVFISIPL